jgi:hypothetical protein
MAEISVWGYQTPVHRDVFISNSAPQRGNAAEDIPNEG